MENIKGQISIFDCLDEKQNINIIEPHISIENAYVLPTIKVNAKSNRKQYEHSPENGKYDLDELEIVEEK